MQEQQFLSEAIRPRGNRDECGLVGESLHQLADALEQSSVTVVVSYSATPADIWSGFVTVVRDHPKRAFILKGKFRGMLRLLRKAVAG